MPISIISVQTTGQGHYDITGHAARFVAKQRGADGLLTVFVRHTSCSLIIQENADPDVRRDLLAYFHRLVPPSDHPDMRYISHTIEGPDDMPAHIKAALTQTSLSIPVAGGAMLLGTWQAIYLFEHRDAPHHRQIALQFLEDR